MGRGRLGSQQGVQRTLAARQPAAAAVSVSPADAIRESLRNDGTMDLAAFNKLSDDDLKWRQLRPTDTQRFFNQIGWADGKPLVLDDKAYEAARTAAGADSLYHTDAPYGSLSTKRMLDQFRKGTQYLSGGVHGDGTYLAKWASDSWSYGNGDPTARQQKMFLNKNARVVSEGTLYQQILSWADAHPKSYAALNRMSQGYKAKNAGNSIDGSQSVFAAMLGYNVIKHGGYYAVLNRKAVTVAKSHKIYSKLTDWENW